MKGVKTMEGYKVTNLVGTPIDYSNRNNWVYLPERTDKEVDTFFVYPTVYINPAPDAPSIVPVEDEMYRAAVQGHFNEAPQAFVDLTNLYEPYYRQSNLAALAGLNKKEFMEYQYKEHQMRTIMTEI
jgi:hypothetical protein